MFLFICPGVNRIHDFGIKYFYDSKTIKAGIPFICKILYDLSESPKINLISIFYPGVN